MVSLHSTISVQFFSFSCCFWKFWPNNRLAFTPFGVGTPSKEICSCCDMKLHPSLHPGEVTLMSQTHKWQQCRMLLKKGHRHRGLTAIDKVKPTTAHLLAVYAGKPVQGTMPKMLNYKGCVAYNWQEKT